ncbi:MAG TPA: DinB family protein [Candidatus Kapabacteria bacterium]|nr:DinB family protein [Candidatus Kapabacteria bacterium]
MPDYTIEDYRRQYDEVREDAAKLLEGLGPEQFNWRPEPHRWSIGDCINHLNIVGHAYIPLLEKAIAEGRAAGRTASSPFRHGWLGNLFVGTMEPPVRMKVRAPRMMQVLTAQHDLDAEEKEFMRQQDEFCRLVGEADGLDLGKIRITSVVTRLLRLSLGQWFWFVVAHERRHLWQAWNVRNNDAFPSA